MKGIVLAGGAGTRLYPLTIAVSKQLLPVYDKPMIYYPLSTLMLAGIREILLISTPADTPRFESLLGDGERLGLRLRYAVQPSPDGLAQALLIGREHLGDEPCAMILGDNILCGSGLSALLERAGKRAARGRATLFACLVRDPERFGVVSLDSEGRLLSIEEKPEHPKSSFASVGLYFFPRGVSDRAETIRPSPRGELEITSLHELYLRDGQLDVEPLGRGYAWFDTGTVDSLIEAAEYIRMMENRRGVLISAPEEIAFAKGWISRKELLGSAERCGCSPYGAYLRALADGRGDGK